MSDATPTAPDTPVSHMEAPYETTGPEAPDTPKAPDAPAQEPRHEPQPKPQPEPQTEPESEKPDTPLTDEQLAATANREKAEEAVRDAGLDFTALEREYAANGELSAASLAALEKAGISKPMVDAYIRGQEAMLRETVNEMTALAGGEEGYKAMTEWAAASLPKAEIEAFNTAVSSGNRALVRIAVAGLAARWKASEGDAPGRLVGGRADAGGAGGGDGFRSSAEMVAAMRDPRYGRDDAYTRDVERRTANATFFGF